MMDPVEAYARECAASTVSASLELMLPAGYSFAGALGQGGVWVAWKGRRTVQAAPATMQTIGLASSGRGKSSQLKLWDAVTGQAFKAAESDVQHAIAKWAAGARKSVDTALAASKPNPAAPAGKVALDEWLRASKVAHKLIDQIDIAAASGLVSVYSDATAEAVVSNAIDYGGCAFVRAAEQDILDNLTRYSGGGGGSGSGSGSGSGGGSGSGASVTLFTDGWDGAPYRRARKGSGIEHTSALVMSMAMMTQEESFIKSFSPVWLDKGVLGRALVARERGMDVSEVLDRDLKLRNGGIGDLESAHACSVAFGGIAGLGGVCRALRLLENRVARATAAAGADASEYLRDALLAAQGLPRPLTLQSLAVSAGAGAGAGGGVDGIGTVLWVPDAAATRLEDLHAWLVRVLEFALGGDIILGPVLSRWTYHLVRLAGIRSLLLGLAEVDVDVLADCGTRLGPWLLHHHLDALAMTSGRAAMEEVRSELVRHRGRDTSMGRQLLDALRMSGVTPADLPMNVRDVQERAARGNRGTRAFKQGISAYMKEQYRLQCAAAAAAGGGADGGDGIFVFAQGRKVGSTVIAGFGPESGVVLGPEGLRAYNSGMAAAAARGDG